MTDLTVLVSPIPLYTGNKGIFALPQQRPIMVTLETTIDPSVTQAAADTTPGRDEHPSQDAARPVVDPAFLSPPVNTFKSRPSHPRHRPTRSQSAPPERRASQEHSQESRQEEDQYGFPYLERRAATPPFTRSTIFGPPARVIGELVRPPPPLFRPTTFWRKTRRSGVTSASYSPGSYLIRRSTYIAAGLKFDSPVHDLSALCVESRIERVVCKATNEDGLPGL